MIIKSVFQRGTRTAVATYRFSQEKGLLGSFTQAQYGDRQLMIAYMAMLLSAMGYTI